MSGDAQTFPPPPVMWAQRYNTILLSICLEDCKKPEIKILNDSVYFKGKGGKEQKEYEVTINLYQEIDPAKSVYSVGGRIIEFVLQKKNGGPFWPQLTKEKIKYHWLKIDFHKWQDEGSDDDEKLGSSAFDTGEFIRNLAKDSDDYEEDSDDNPQYDSDDGDIPSLKVI